MQENKQQKDICSPEAEPGTPEGHGISPELQAWGEKVLSKIQRMAEDEEYRKQVTSFLP